VAFSCARGDHYDDIVFYRAWVDYLPGAAEAYCQITLPKNSPQQEQEQVPGLVQDGAMTQACGDAAESLTGNGHACQFLICRGGRLVPGLIDLTGKN
jgi:hypothetical protein